MGGWVDGLLCLSWFQITQKEIWTWYQDGTTFTAIVGSASEPRRSGQPTEVTSFLISVPTISGKRAAGLGGEHRAGETVETGSDFIFLGSKITAVGDCSHEIKRRLISLDV